MVCLTSCAAALMMFVFGRRIATVSDAALSMVPMDYSELSLQAHLLCPDKLAFSDLVDYELGYQDVCSLKDDPDNASLAKDDAALEADYAGRFDKDLFVHSEAYVILTVQRFFTMIRRAVSSIGSTKQRLGTSLWSYRFNAMTLFHKLVVQPKELGNTIRHAMPGQVNGWKLTRVLQSSASTTRKDSPVVVTPDDDEVEAEDEDDETDEYYGWDDDMMYENEDDDDEKLSVLAELLEEAKQDEEPEWEVIQVLDAQEAAAAEARAELIFKREAETFPQLKLLFNLLILGFTPLATCIVAREIISAPLEPALVSLWWCIFAQTFMEIFPFLLRASGTFAFLLQCSPLVTQIMALVVSSVTSTSLLFVLAGMSRLVGQSLTFDLARRCCWSGQNLAILYMASSCLIYGTGSGSLTETLALLAAVLFALKQVVTAGCSYVTKVDHAIEIA